MSGDGDETTSPERWRTLVAQMRENGIRFVDMSTSDTTVEQACDQYEHVIRKPRPKGFREALSRISETIGESTIDINAVAASHMMWEFSGVDQLRDTLQDLLEWAREFARDVPRYSYWDADELTIGRVQAQSIDRRRPDLEEFERTIRDLSIRLMSPTLDP